jgi:hypothetical protein
VDITPNRIIPGEIAFEPLGPGIRVTARDASHRTLWGFVACREMLREVHCLVAVYDTFRSYLAEELRKHGLPAPQTEDVIKCAEQALNDLEQTVDTLRKSITVKKVSEATIRRAEVIRSIVTDAVRMIELATKSLNA